MAGSASHAGFFLLCGPLLSNRTLFGRALSLSAEKYRRSQLWPPVRWGVVNPASSSSAAST